MLNPHSNEESWTALYRVHLIGSPSSKSTSSSRIVEFDASFTPRNLDLDIGSSAKRQKRHENVNLFLNLPAPLTGSRSKVSQNSEALLPRPFPAQDAQAPDHG